MAMALYPEVQKKAQKELDKVIGNRLPEFNDRPNLPYINAMMKESLRRQPVVPLGVTVICWIILILILIIWTNPAVAHSSRYEDEYNGYYIPKGTIIFGNSWSVHSLRWEPWLKLPEGQSCMIQRPTKTLSYIILTDFSKTGRSILQYETPRLQLLGTEGGFALGGSWPKIPYLSFYVIFWLSTIYGRLWEMTERKLRLSLRWRMGWSRKFCLRV